MFRNYSVLLLIFLLTYYCYDMNCLKRSMIIHSSRLGFTKFNKKYNKFALRLLSSNKYDHIAVEKKWQSYWEKNETFKATYDPNKPKKYILDMFPYPSGQGLHVGHPEGYTATDIISRYWRMKGFNVLHPMGWDAFGLPAEQHAISSGTHPEETTNKNIQTFKKQLKSLGFSYDWSRELATTDENYVKWTQWIFLQLFKNGLAAQSDITVNWCPKLGTVLANEEIIDGKSERGNHPVVRLPLRQWILKITEYADKLEDGLDGLDWPEGTKSAQKLWIGKSKGALVKFNVQKSDFIKEDFSIEVFTTRPDTLFGVSYIVVSPEHELVDKLVSYDKKDLLHAYKEKVASKSDLERTSIGKDKAKTGLFIGSYVEHPVTGVKLPIWTADYVLPNYGTGAVMAVPAHDERDFEFANKFDLPIIQVIASNNSSDTNFALPYTGEGVIINSGSEYDGLNSTVFKSLAIDILKKKNQGHEKISYKLRDWVFSRQRYWGEPIPIYFPVKMLTDDGHGNPINDDPHEILFDQPIPVDESDLPVRLPNTNNFQPGDDPHGCLAREKEWRYFQKGGKWFARETNTMPQWAGSCWYYLRFTDPQNDQNLFSKQASHWLPVDLYVGGQEHAVLHLLYARFWHKFLFDIGLVNHSEPFLKLFHQGMILGPDGEKMSKSKGNVINPDDVINEHGADALRLYEMFMGPLEATKPWKTKQLIGVVRFREKVYKLVMNTSLTERPNPIVEESLKKEMHKAIKKVTQDIEKLSFNTAISSLMIYTNYLSSIPNPNRRAIENLVILLSPFAPHIAEECWEYLGYNEPVSKASWPEYDENFCIEDRVKIAIQINGKLRGTKEILIDTEKEEVVKMVLIDNDFKKYIGESKIKKSIFVPGKILNLLV